MDTRVITGPPCAGKTTHIAEHRRPNDLVVDLDTIAQALGYPDPHINWNSTHPAVEASREARYAIIGAVLKNRIRANTTAWIIDSNPTPAMLRWYRQAKATITTLDPGAKVCHDRADADQRPALTHQHIDDWYAITTGARPTSHTDWG